MFTRKDYVEMGGAVRHHFEEPYSKEWRAGAASVVRDMADALKRNNPRFRYDTFFEACGLNADGYVIS